MPALSQRDKRALLILGIALPLWLLFYYGLQYVPSGGDSTAVVSSSSIQAAERRLRRLQDLARQKTRVAGEAEAASKALADSEKGLLPGSTPALASAEMQQTMKSMLQAQGIAMQSSDFGAVKAAGEDYAQVPLTVSFTCGIEQWINLMAAIRNAPQVLATQEVRVSPGDTKNKAIQVRMVVAGYIPASIAATAKGAGSL